MANVSIRGLTKKFAEVAAVDDFHLEIGDGEFVSLLGPSGCGKTTTLRLLAGFLQPDGGEIRAGGEVISSPAHLVPPERRQMSMIFQSYAVWPHMTVAQNVAYGLKFKKLTKQEIETKVTKLLGVVHLAELKDRYSAELSGGQQQRVALARALVVEPQILLMDEPLSNLDANLREEMRFEIRRLHEEFKITTVYVTHDQAEAMAVSDCIVVMDRGAIAQAGTPRELYEAPRDAFVAGFMGDANRVRAHLVRKDATVGVVDLGGLEVVLPHRGLTGDVLVSIRPEAIRVVDRGASPLRGTIRKAAYLGNIMEYTIATPIGELFVVASEVDHPQSEGAEVALSLTGHGVVVIAADAR